MPIRAAAVLVGVALLAACGSTIEHPAPGGPSFQDDEVRFAAPTGWQLQPSGTTFSGVEGHIRAYLSTQSLRADCDTALTCQSPLLNGLDPGGMLVTWITRACVASSCDLPPARLTSIGNRHGVRDSVESGCEETGFTERYAYYVTVTPQRVDALFVCARDPSDATRVAFLGFLDAIQWRIP